MWWTAPAPGIECHKAFARGVNREDIIKGAEELGVELNQHITFTIGALRKVAKELGL